MKTQSWEINFDGFQISMCINLISGLKSLVHLLKELDVAFSRSSVLKTTNNYLQALPFSIPYPDTYIGI